MMTNAIVFFNLHKGMEPFWFAQLTIIFYQLRI